jgi:hypothetical protein
VSSVRLDDPHRLAADRPFTELWDSRVARFLAPQWIWLPTIADRSRICQLWGRNFGPWSTQIRGRHHRVLYFSAGYRRSTFRGFRRRVMSLSEAWDHCSGIRAEGLDGARPVTVGFSPHLPHVEQPGCRDLIGRSLVGPWLGDFGLLTPVRRSQPCHQSRSDTRALVGVTRASSTGRGRRLHM